MPPSRNKANVTDATIKQAESEGKAADTLLTFNEPDQAGQANMSVSDALAAWPQLEATGMRLGAPAVSYGGDTPGGWLDQFMTGAKQKLIGRAITDENRWQRVELDLKAVVAGEVEVESLVESRREKGGLPERVTPAVRTEIEVDNRISADFSVVLMPPSVPVPSGITVVPPKGSV